MSYIQREIFFLSTSMRREKNKYKEYLKLKIRSLKLFFVYRQDHEAENNRLMINNHIKNYHALTANDRYTRFTRDIKNFFLLR